MIFTGRLSLQHPHHLFINSKTAVG